MPKRRAAVCLLAGIVACVLVSATSDAATATTRSIPTPGPTPGAGTSPSDLAGAGIVGRPPNIPPVAPDCRCVCKFPAQGQIVLAGTKKGPGGGTTYSFNASVLANCAGPTCKVIKVTYAWKHTGGTSVSVYTSESYLKTYYENVTRPGTLSLECTVTVTCNNGAKCSSKGSKTFTVTP